MRHIFVVNPDAGRGNPLQEVESRLATCQGNDEIEVHVTANAREAADFIRATRANVDGPQVSCLRRWDAQRWSTQLMGCQMWLRYPQRQ